MAASRVCSEPPAACQGGPGSNAACAGITRTLQQPLPDPTRPRSQRGRNARGSKGPATAGHTPPNRQESTPWRKYSRRTPPGEDAPEFAVALGCEIHHARDLVYADDIESAKRRQHDAIGIGCAVCERMDCTQRAHPPVGHDVRFDGNSRRVGLYNLET